MIKEPAPSWSSSATRTAHAVRRNRRDGEPEDRRRVRVRLTPIVCIGETLDQRERARRSTCSTVKIKAGLDGVTAAQLGSAGARLRARLGDRHRPQRDAAQAGRGASPIRSACAVVRSRAADLCRVIYGGSVKPENIRDLVAQPDVDGALVGGASLDVRAFSNILEDATGAV
jgi:triosephosphate isomerase